MPFVPATPKQQEYMAILFIDCGFTRQERNAWLGEELLRDIKFLDDLSGTEASVVIDKLKEIKAGKRKKPEVSDDE